MTRVCPSCKTELKESDYYFCTSCGAELTDGTNANVSSYAFKVTKFNTPSRRIGFKPILMIFASILLISGVFFLLKFGLTLLPKHTSSAVLQQQSKPKPQTNSNVVATDISLPDIKFGMPTLITYIPDNIDFYIESGDFKEIYNAFTKDFDEKPFIDVLLLDVSDQFIFVGREVDSTWQLGLFLKITNQSHILELLDNLENKNWRVALVKDVLVISNSDKFIEDSVSASNGIVKNVSLNPKFVTSKSQLQESGKLLFIDLNAKSNSAYSLLSYYKAGKSVQAVFDDAKTREYDKFVVIHE